MITILLVCIFFGINARVYLNFDNMNATLEVILPLNLTVISVRFNLHNKTLYYNINKGKVRQINIKNNKRKNKKQYGNGHKRQRRAGFRSRRKQACAQIKAAPAKRRLAYNQRQRTLHPRQYDVRKPLKKA